MRCLVIETFKRKGEPQHLGSIIEVPDGVFPILSKFVIPAEDAVDRCKASKVGDRLCGAKMRTGINGWRSCSDPVAKCQQFILLGGSIDEP